MFKYIFLLILAAISYFVFFADITLTNEAVGQIFVAGIFTCLLVFLLFKFGLHYKIHALNRFVLAFHYSVFEYKKAQQKPSGLNYMDSVREQAEVALAANFDSTLSTAALKIPVSLYSGKDPFLEKLRAKIQAAEKMKLEARQLDGKAEVLLGKTKELLVERHLADDSSTSKLDSMFDIVGGVAHIVDVTVGELKDQSYEYTPDYDIITRIALDNNPYFASTFKFFDSEDVLAILFRAPFMIILLGIIGTFAGFYLALDQGGDIKSGAAVAIISSLVGLPVSLLMDYINTLFPDKTRYQQAFNKYKVSLELLFNHERELDAAGQDRRKKGSRLRVPVSAFEKAEESKAEESKVEESKAEKTRAKKTRAENSRAKKSRAEKPKAEKSEAEKSKEEKSEAGISTAEISTAGISTAGISTAGISTAEISEDEISEVQKSSGG